MEAPTDSQLMREVQAGDLDKVAELYARHAENVHALCYRMTGSAETSADLVQDVFLRVLRYRASFRGEARFTTWLYRIARNTCLSHLEAGRKRWALLQRWRRQLAVEHDGPPGTEGGSHRRLALERALARLPEDRRQALILSRYHGLPYREIAEVVGCSEGAARVRVHRALKQLRKWVHAMEHGDDDRLRTNHRATTG